jgi:hypothetical protein
MAKITEPMTMITDYMITILTVVVSLLLVRFELSLSQIFWIMALLFTGLASLGGGTSHGFKEFLGEKNSHQLWKWSVALIGLANLFMIWGSLPLFSLFSILVILAFIQLLVFLYWFLLKNDSFIVVIMNYIPSMLVVAAIQIYFMLQGSTAALYFLLGILVSLIAAGIQISLKGKLPKWFNHNDLFHLVQMIAIWCFYIGIKLL